MKINIAIDGLSSTGKSSLAKRLAQELRYIYIDSGAMYRAITLYLLQNEIEIKQDTDEIKKALVGIDLRFVNQRVCLNGHDVEEEIRTMYVSNSVSEVAALPSVRDFCVQQQQAYGEAKGVVMDGRDIGTVVFPKAELKIFLTAAENVRIERRYSELLAKGKKITREEVGKNLAHRDEIDSNRSYNPLRKAEDARELDNSSMTIPEQVKQIKNWVIELVERS